MADTSPLPGPATGPNERGQVQVEDVHGEEIAVEWRPDPLETDDEALIRAKLQDQRTVVTASGEYHIDEVGELVFAPYPEPDLGPRAT
jgi:hypothetical protein